MFLAAIIGIMLAVHYASSVPWTPRATIAAASPREQILTTPDLLLKPTLLDEPLAVVKTYYKALNERRYGTAYSLFTSAAQLGHPYASFARDQSSIVTTDVEFLRSNGSVVNVKATEHHSDGLQNPHIFERFWKLSKSPDGRHWRLNRGDFPGVKLVSLATPSAATEPLANKAVSKSSGWDSAPRFIPDNQSQPVLILPPNVPPASVSVGQPDCEDESINEVHQDGAVVTNHRRNGISNKRS